jgi:hypothetical protein
MLEHPSPSPHMLLFSGVNMDPENMACKIESSLSSLVIGLLVGVGIVI